MTSQPGKQTIIVHIFPNISRINDIEKMKYGCLIEYNMRNFFLEKSYTKCDQNWTYLGINNLEFYTVFLILYIENILKLSCKPPAFTSNKALLKNEKRSGTSLPASFSAQFFFKKIMSLYSFNWPNCIVWLPLLCGILDNMCTVIVSNQVVMS